MKIPCLQFLNLFTFLCYLRVEQTNGGLILNAQDLVENISLFSLAYTICYIQILFPGIASASEDVSAHLEGFMCCHRMWRMHGGNYIDNTSIISTDSMFINFFFLNTCIHYIFNCHYTYVLFTALQPLFMGEVSLYNFCRPTFPFQIIFQVQIPKLQFQFF